MNLGGGMDHNLLLDSLLVGYRNVTQLVAANYEAPRLDWPVSAGHSKNSLRGLADVDGGAFILSWRPWLAWTKFISIVR